MSVKIMSAIFETEFFDLPLPEPDKDGNPRKAKGSSLKLVLLALADHANDEGESSYPGLTKLQRKTALSRQGLVDVLSAIMFNGLAFVSEEPSKLGTNNYTINLKAFPCLLGEKSEKLLVKSLDYQSSHLTSASQVALPEVVKSLDLNHPLTTNEPDRFRAVIEKLESINGSLNGMTADYVNGWLKVHEDKWIYNAIAVSVANKIGRAGFVKYTDEVLLNWETHGYPLPREERVKAGRSAANKNQSILDEYAKGV